MGNPVALFLLSEISIFALYCLDHHDREIVYGVAWGVKTGSYRFVKPLVVDIAVVLRRILRFCVSPVYTGILGVFPPQHPCYRVA